MGVASLVLGILSIILNFVPGLGLIGAVMGIVGIILGALGKKNNQSCATAGMVLSIIGTILCLLFYIACAMCVGGLASMM